MAFHNDWTELDDKEMKNANCQPYSHEHWISGNILEDIEFIINLSRRDHIEDLQENENIEYDGEMSWRSIGCEVLVDLGSVKVFYHTIHNGIVFPSSPIFNWMLFCSCHCDTKRFIIFNVISSLNTLWNEFVSKEDKCEKNDNLEQGHTTNVFDHFSWDNIFCFPIWWSFKEFIFWSFSSESERSKRVHNHVYPKKLNSGKWRFPKNASSTESSS